MTTLSDLNDNPALIDEISDQEVIDLYEEAEKLETPLAGTLMQDLYAEYLAAVEVLREGTTDEALD